MGWLIAVGGDVVEAGTFDFTLSDPGGCETATITGVAGRVARVGAPVRISNGAREVWVGEVEEPGQRASQRAVAAAIAAVGAGTVLKRNPYSMVYVDRQLSAWTGPPLDREIGLAPDYSPVAVPSPTPAGDGLKLELAGEMPGLEGAICEAWYDAGPENKIERVEWDGVESFNYSGGGVWQSLLVSAADVDEPMIVQLSWTSLATDVNATFPVADRFAILQLVYGETYTADTLQRWRILKGLRTLGDHGLTVYEDGGGNRGLRASDIARDAFQRAGADLDLIIDPSSDAVITHLVSKTRQPPEKWIADAATFAGAWHWGVWPSRRFDGRPVGMFVPPASGRVYTVDYRDLVNPDITERMSAMHNLAHVRYRLPDGAERSLMVRIDHPRLPPGVDQALDVDAGIVGNPASAQAIGTYQLQLDQTQSRAAGSVTLPYVLTPAGARVPAWVLRPGIDRLRINGLPSTGSWLAAPPARVDTFRVSRLSVSVANGRETIRADLDAGADLTETLTARLTAAGTLAGQ